MTPEEFRARRRALHISAAEMGRLFGVGERAVRRWEAGERQIPGPVRQLLRVIWWPLLSHRREGLVRFLLEE